MSKIEFRIWENSSLIGKRVSFLCNKFNVTISKISRGTQASDNQNIILDEADYICVEGTPQALALIVESSGPKGKYDGKNKR